MDTSIVSVMAGVLGSVFGASTTIAIAWITQKTLHKRELIRGEIDKREMLYGEFIAECSKLILDAFGHTLERPETLLSAYALLNRIRLSASDTVFARAEHILMWITERYFSPNLTTEDMRALVHSPGNDPLKPFSEACRDELKSITSVHGDFVTAHFRCKK
ncbi:MAG: hypothetical protein ABSB95_13285 [Dissulfurispiraceae bacterium]